MKQGIIVKRILVCMDTSRRYIDAGSRRRLVRFVRSRWNPDGGVRGRDEKSDLYYTVFAVLCMRALSRPVPLLRLWRFVQSHGEGESLDAVHLFCLIRLRTLFPSRVATRRKLMALLEAKQADSAYDMFFKVVAAEYLGLNDRPEEELLISSSQTTPNVAAAVVINHRENPAARRLLLDRFCQGGGFRASATAPCADLLSTATALFALRLMETDMEPIRDTCLDFIESLWRDNGGFAGYAQDGFEDVEYTFYALLSIGCLME